MLNDLTIEQKELASLMSELSERCYSAGWLQNLEYILWEILLKGEQSLGQDRIHTQDIKQLNQLSKDYNCWIYNNDETEETAIELSLWKQKFDKAISQNPDIIKG